MRSFHAVPVLLALGITAAAQKPNSYPNPYRTMENWAQVPDTIKWGQVIGANPDAHGNLWVFHRSEPPLMQFDGSGKLLKTMGEGMFVNPHGLHIDRDKQHLGFRRRRAQTEKASRYSNSARRVRSLLTLGDSRPASPAKRPTSSTAPPTL